MKLKYISQSCVMVELGGKIVYFDPYQIPSGSEKADIVLISHDHFDHFEEGSLKIIKKADTKVFGPQTMKNINSIGKGLSTNDSVQLFSLSIKTVPAYNPSKKFHPKSNGFIGFIVSDGKTTIYHAGDTDLIPEMKNIQGIDYAFLPVGDYFTMGFNEAIEALKIIRPKNMIPIHSEKKDLSQFAKLVKEKIPEVNCIILKSEQVHSSA